MFRFIHTYDEVFVKGLFEKGLVNPADGFKIPQHFLTPPERKFNIYGNEGTTLFQLINQRRTVFYIDRLHGGTFYSRYDYDKKLMQTYEDMLGDNFLGVQLHECGNVRALDWKRITSQLKDTPFPWSEQQIHDAVQKVSHNKQTIHLSCGSSLEYSRLAPPKVLSDYFDDINNLIALRQRENDGRVLMCDPGIMPFGIERENNVRTGMVEIGAQSLHARMQIAFRRGVSGVLNREWGTYYEPWGGDPISTCMYCTDKANEWYITPENFPYTSQESTGGSSRSLQRRICFYSLFSGADYLSEEWGQCNTFYNWNDFALSPYGEVKKEFLTYAAKFTDIVPFVPIALVIPHEIKILTTNKTDGNGTYLGFKNDVADFDKTVNALCHIYDAVLPLTSEDHILTNSRFGSLFDIIYDDSCENALSKYKYVVDFSGRLNGENVIPFVSEEALDEKLNEIIAGLLPFEIKGDCADYVLFDNFGKHYVALFNNSGVKRSIAGGETVMPEAKSEIYIKFLNHSPVGIDGFENRVRTEGCGLDIMLEGGGIVLIEYK